MVEENLRMAPQWFDELLRWLAFGFEVGGVIAIVGALIVSLVQAAEHIAQRRSR